MAELSSKQANELADMFLKIAQLTGNYRYSNSHILSETEDLQIQYYHTSLLNQAGQLYTESAALVMNDVEPAISSIENSTLKIKSSYRNLQNVTKVINIVDSIVRLGSSILSRKPLKIAEAIDDLVNKLE
jgi:hypothetical protein